jgi:hypothetical protein
MLYYYAHTGHKVGLERLRRGIALKHALEKHDIDMQMLVNDFRAGVALKDEQGLSEYITIETIQDIDAVAQMGDSVIIDSDEDDHGRLVKYVADFKQVWRFAHDSDDKPIHGEILLTPECSDENCIEGMIIDDIYFQKQEKRETILFFLKDDDHEKAILSHKVFFQAFDMELLLGHYFFVKYEKDLSGIFNTLHEPEMYTETITTCSTVVTGSSQAALEARASGAKVIFLNTENNSLYSVDVLEKYGILILDGFDSDALRTLLERNVPETAIPLHLYDKNLLLKKFNTILKCVK